MDTKVTPPVSQLNGGALKDLVSLRIFTRVVELQSFSEVARRAGVTPATVSKHIASLEAQLRTRLLNRTTRRLFITEAGQRLYEHCIRVFEELEQAEADVAGLLGEPSGGLRVTAPLILGVRRISPRLPEFLRLYPKVTIDLDFSVEKIDLFQRARRRRRTDRRSDRPGPRRVQARTLSSRVLRHIGVPRGTRHAGVAGRAHAP